MSSSTKAAAAAYSDDQLIVAARMYFIDEMSQAEVGKTLGVSQAKVSRMLGLARQQGIVQIKVPDYNPRDNALEDALTQRFGLKAAIVIRRIESQSIDDLRNTIGYFAAPEVATWISPGATVAIAGGRTLQALAHRMQPSQAAKNVSIVQAMGSIDETSGSYDALEIGRKLASRWSGSFVALNTPAIVKDPNVCRHLLEVEQIKNVLEVLKKSTVAFVGIGTLHNSLFRERNALTESDIAKLLEAGAVGEVVGRFYDANGGECDTPLRSRVIGIGLGELQRMDLVAGIVAGSDRTEALLAALRGRILNALVIDDAAATSLLESSP
ncbi:sugar-binding transcriptional regulator [Aeoliella sp.]|uniref:sugar-binding transcriptional regulator n=1 Tax=Aeoliella sp. TaxID=2795800 RepID=UPI003CCB801C